MGNISDSVEHFFWSVYHFNGYGVSHLDFVVYWDTSLTNLRPLTSPLFVFLGSSLVNCRLRKIECINVLSFIAIEMSLFATVLDSSKEMYVFYHCKNGQEERCR